MPDLFAMAAEIAGARPRKTLDGRALKPILRGGKLADRPLLWHYPHYSNQGGVPSGAVRDGDWKLIEFYEYGRLEPFHLRSDACERYNLVNKHAAKAREMRATLNDWRNMANAAMPKVNPAYDPATADQGLTGGEKPTVPIG